MSNNNILENDNYNPSDSTKNTNKSDTDKIKTDLTNLVNTTKNNLQQQITGNDNDIKSLKNKDTELQNNINTAKSDLTNLVNTTKNNLTNTINTSKNDAINSAKSYTDNYAIKVGFIYIQLRRTQTPDQIFKTSGKWQDISSQYAGEFFRAVGGNSSSFGLTQAEGLPNLTAYIASDRLGLYCGEYSSGAVISHKSAFSGASVTAEGRGTDFNFNASRYNPIYGASANVTPYNSAVRIWKKIA